MKSFVPEAIVPKRKERDCMEEDLQEGISKEGIPQNEVLTVENLNRLNDAFAKYIFANEERKLLTMDLVNSFFEFEGTAQITDFTFSDRELDPDRKRGKGVVLDVVGKSSDGTLTNVEIQLQQFDDMDRRTLYYWSQLYNRRLVSGEDYENLNRTVTINILDYRLFKDETWPYYHSCFAVLNTKDVRHALTKDLEVHFVELPKLTSSNQKSARHLERWLRYLSPKTTMEERRRLAMEDANIQTAMEAEKEFVKDPLYITAYEQRQKDLRDQHARDKFVRKEGEAIGEARGFAKGEASGIAKGIAKAVLSLRKKGKTDAVIAELLDLDIKEVQMIQ